MDAAASPIRLRIAVVAPCPFPSARGSQVLIRELAEDLAARGHEVHVVAYPVGEHLVPLRGITVHRTFTIGKGWIGRLPWLVRKFIWDSFLVFTLYRVVKRHDIQVLHAHNYEGPLVAWLAKRLSRCPLVYHAHNLLSDELPTYFGVSIARWLARILGGLADRCVPRLADVVVVLSRSQKEGLSARGVRPDRVVLLPPAAPEIGRRMRNSGALRPVPDGRFVVGYAGNLDPYQEIGLLVRAFRLLRERVPSVALLLVTHDGDWMHNAPDEFVELARLPEVNVVVCRSFGEACLWLGRASVWVCPRSSWSGFPIKLLNFVVLGKPVVLSSGVARGVGWVDEETTFQVGQPVALANVLLRMAQDPQALERAAEAARRFAASLPSRAKVAEALERLLAWAWWLGASGFDGAHRIPEHDLGVDRLVVTSYKRSDVSREDEARA